MEPIFVDTHAHYNLPAFEHDLDEVMLAIRAAGVGRVICPAISSEAFEKRRVVLLTMPD